jgi:hypothetical protein
MEPRRAPPLHIGASSKRRTEIARIIPFPARSRNAETINRFPMQRAPRAKRMCYQWQVWRDCTGILARSMERHVRSQLAHAGREPHPPSLSEGCWLELVARSGMGRDRGLGHRGAMPTTMRPPKPPLCTAFAGAAMIRESRNPAPETPWSWVQGKHAARQ